MALKDIVNRDIVNLQNCEQEPIHIPGSIQPHGVLLALADTDFTIKYCSGNIAEYTGLELTDVLNKPVSSVIGAAQFTDLKAHTANLHMQVSAPYVISIGDRKFQSMVHRSSANYICELEPVSEEIPRVSTVYDQALHFAKYMEQAQTLRQLCQSVAEEIKTLTGYDRVMIYRFDKDYNGEVYAESKNDELESFFGLHYPHTDIPVQARQLYIQNQIRIIVDINYKPVPIYTTENSTNKDLDLSQSVLRSTSPIHVEYLKNMGVGGTLTISLIHQGKLWGLVACHHYSAKYIDHYTRIIAQLQGQFLTSQINVREMAQQYAGTMAINTALETLLNQHVAPDRKSLQKFVEQPQILQLCNANGVAIILDNVVYKTGATPIDDNILMIAAKAQQINQKGVYSSDHLSKDIPQAEHLNAVASGIIYYQLTARNGCIIWFRKESLQEISWAGDPHKAIVKDKNGLSPRKSFEKYQQIVKQHSKPWREAELTAAATFAYTLQKHITLLLSAEEEERQRELTRRLQESNLELENIQWISTHDLKEPLRKLQLFATRLLEYEEGITPEVSATIKKMNASAERMQRLISDITSYAKVRQAEVAMEEVDLRATIVKIEQDYHDDISERKARIITRNLGLIHGVPLLIDQLFVNLVGNSMKFRREGVPPQIEIIQDSKLSKAPIPEDNRQFYKITVRDNGIGFENEFVDKLFKVFSRLHDRQTYEGTGIGLALCKKIMQLHHGYITADGEPGVGATFTIYFPK